MAESIWQVCDELWGHIAPLMPRNERDARGGRPRVDDRVCFSAIMFVLFTGIAWRHLPARARCLAGHRASALAGVGAGRRVVALARRLLRRLNADGRIDWTCAVVDSSHIRALQGGLDRTFIRRPRERPRQVRRELWRRGIKPIIARRCTKHGTGLGTRRWIVERTFAWLHFFRRLRIWWERDPDLHLAFMSLGCAVICWRYLRGS